MSEQKQQVFPSACTFEIDLEQLRFTDFTATDGIFGIDRARVLTDLADFRKLSIQQYCRAIGLYFSRADEAALPYQAFSALLQGQPYSYRAHMRNAVKRSYQLCEVEAAPIFVDGKPVRATGTITPVEE